MKNVKGGYKIISLEENDLTSSFSVNGIYNALSKTYDKTILVSGIVISGEKKNDAYTEVNVDSTDYKFTVYGYEVTVASDDSVEAEAVTLDAVTSIGGVSGAITLGTGLSITEEGELSATGGGGGTLYQHNISFASTSGTERIQVSITLVTTDSTAFVSTSEVASYIRTKTNSAYITASGLWHLGAEGAPYVVIYLLYFSTTDVYGLGISLSDYTVVTNSSKTFGGLTLSDRVVEIS